jgi:hypothetical protein
MTRFCRQLSPYGIAPKTTVGHDKGDKGHSCLKQRPAPGLRCPHTAVEGVFFSPPAKLRPAARRDNTTIIILVMMRSILVQHLDIVPELRGVGSAVMRT